jgi:DNA-binding response OmpR family regulator
VLQVASRALRAHGYEVSTARDGRQGAELFRARSEEIDVVLLDLTMPEMDGEQALVAMRAARPDVRAIVASGYDEDEARHRFRERPPSAFLRKPYSIESLAAKVKEVLSQPAHARG